LGKRVHDLRAAKKWSQEEFAHVSGAGISDRFDASPMARPSSSPESRSDRVTPSTPATFDRFSKLMFFSPRSICPM